ncbi:MAG: hypothetical protein JWN34_2856 [Bryobacterales bacterium]|nr:hypothetical protein [Bryobacterales bacterium]
MAASPVKNAVETGTLPAGVRIRVSPKRLATILDIKASTLERWRVMGSGPPYRKLNGAVRYALDEVEAWAQQCRSGGSRAV